VHVRPGPMDRTTLSDHATTVRMAPRGARRPQTGELRLAHRARARCAQRIHLLPAHQSSSSPLHPAAACSCSSAGARLALRVRVVPARGLMGQPLWDSWDVVQEALSEGRAGKGLSPLVAVMWSQKWNPPALSAAESVRTSHPSSPSTQSQHICRCSGYRTAKPACIC
jgi:hypothetical protein